MSYKHCIEVADLLDSPRVTGADVAEYLRAIHDVGVDVRTVEGETGSTDFLSLRIPGRSGKSAGGEAPTLGIVGQLGGIGARPARIGYVSDGDGALAAVAAAAKLLSMHERGDVLPGDVVVTTHIDPAAPTRPHKPVPQMGASLDIDVIARELAQPEADAILSIDTTKGNRIANARGFALTPTVRSGWILRVSEDLVTIAERVTNRPALTIPITMQDITPYGSGVYHMNSLVQPATMTSAPVVGVAITAETAVPGSGTGASDLASVESAVRFAIEVAKEFTADDLAFFDPADFDRLVELYGDMTRLQKV